jgi:hypothetical protein
MDWLIGAVIIGVVGFFAYRWLKKDDTTPPPATDGK